MSASVSVVGVLGWCWVRFGRPTQSQTTELAGWRASVAGVLGLRTRTRRRVFFSGAAEGEYRVHANPQTLNKPNTLNTTISNQLILLSFHCVGSVLGCGSSCWVVISEGWQ